MLTALFIIAIMAIIPVNTCPLPTAVAEWFIVTKAVAVIGGSSSQRYPTARVTVKSRSRKLTNFIFLNFFCLDKRLRIEKQKNGGFYEKRKE